MRRLARFFAYYSNQETRLRRIDLPDTNLSVSRLSFGTASLHHLPTSFQRQSLLAVAAEQGFTHFDTAPYYGYGLAELELGQFLKACDNSYTVATKVGLYPPCESRSITSLWSRKALGKFLPRLSKPIVDWSIKRASDCLHTSLKRLGRDYVDILFLHEPEPGLVDADEFLNWLGQQREKGKIRFWGLAGPAEKYKVWIDRDHDLAQVVQALDHIGEDVHPLLSAGRCFQLTYGYLAPSKQGQNSQMSVSNLLHAALTRNSLGSVLVSTRRKDHLAELASIEERS